MSQIPSLPSPWEIAEEIINVTFGTEDGERRGWWEEFASQYERDHDLEPRDLPAFKTTVVRQAGVLWTSDELPAFVMFPALEPKPVYDANSGCGYADVAYGILVAVEADDERDSGRTLHDLVGVVKQLFETRLFDHELERTNVDYRGLELQDGGRTLYGADLDYLAKRVLVGVRTDPLTITEPREDPYTGPIADGPTVETAEIIVTPMEAP